MAIGRGGGFDLMPVKEDEVIEYLIWTIHTPKISPLDTNRMKDRIKHSHSPVRVVTSRP